MAKKKQRQRNNKKKKNRNQAAATANSQSIADADDSSARDDMLFAEYMTNSDNAFKRFQSLAARGEKDGDSSAEDMKKVCVLMLLFYTISQDPYVFFVYFSH